MLLSAARWFLCCAVLAQVRYEATPMKVVDAMLELAAVNAQDVVYDLGCGDGRIVIQAARRFGARGVCVDIDPRRTAESRANARKAGVSERIRFRTEDLLATELGGATVVTLFLSPELNDALSPRLRALKPGTRVVSHWHSIAGWPPDATIHIRGDWGRERTVYLWTVR